MPTLPKIIGVSGTNGSGKDTFGRLLHEKYGYHTISLSDVLRAELTLLGRPIDRQNLSSLSQEIRHAEGEGGMVVRAIAMWQQTGVGEGLCLTSIRAPGEAETIQQQGGQVVWVDADPAVRYARVQAANRGRQLEDNLSFEEFMQQQAREMTPSESGGGLNMAGVKAIADHEIINDFDSLAEYEAAVLTFLEQL